VAPGLVPAFGAHLLPLFAVSGKQFLMA
jgi:hypothetical protein